MSLSKQLFLFVTALFLIIFSLNFALSVKNIKSYVDIEARGHAQDTATSLGLSLSPYMIDEKDPILETMIKAIFDMGSYQAIQLVNLEGKPLVTLNRAAGVVQVPRWFSQWFSIPTVTASSEISAGWNPAGYVFVTTDSGNATTKVYDLVKSAFFYSLLVFCISIALLLFLLRFVLLPLKQINQLALTIANGQFATLTPLPWTTDVRDVAHSMNIMSQKIAGIVEKSKTKLALLNLNIQRDDLTGLKKKSCFEADLKQLFMEPEPAFVLMIKVDSLSTLVKEQNILDIDLFLKHVADVLQQVTAQVTSGLISHYRIFGSEFVLLVRKMTRADSEQLADSLSRAFTELAAQYQRVDIAHIGITAFNPLGSTASILAAANEAFEQAKLIGANAYYFRCNNDLAKDSAAWKKLVFAVIEQHDYTVDFSGAVVDFKSTAILMEDAVMQACDQGREILPIGTFVAIAEKFSKIVDLDRGITQKVIAYIQEDAIQHAVAVSLSTRTVKNPAFRRWLASALAHQPVAKQLVFSFSAYTVAKEIAVYQEFIEFVHGLGAKVMLKRFETQFISLEVAHALKADYLRLPRNLSNALNTDHSKRHFVETLQDVATLLDIPLLAENVLDDADYTLVQQIGLMGASR